MKFFSCPASISEASFETGDPVLSISLSRMIAALSAIVNENFSSKFQGDRNHEEFSILFDKLSFDVSFLGLPSI